MPKAWRLSDDEVASVRSLLTHGAKNPDSGVDGIVHGGALLLSFVNAPAEDPEVLKLRARVAELEEQLKASGTPSVGQPSATEGAT